MHSKALQDIVDLAVSKVGDKTSKDALFPNVEKTDLAIFLADVTNSEKNSCAGYQQEEPFFPASIVKLFYAVAAYHWLEQGKIKKTAEFDRAMKAMIVNSSNDATSYIVDVLTGTASGPELPEGQMKEWMHKRNAVNRFFSDLGYKNINVNQKTWGDTQYGREKVFVDSVGKNSLTAQLTGKFLIDIFQKQAADKKYCEELLSYMYRDRSISSDDPNSQTHAFVGKILPPDAKFWSKAGWTTVVRHDSFIAEFANGKKICLVIFTQNHATEPALLPFIGSQIVKSILGP